MRVVMATLHHLGQRVAHVVAQIVEAELVVGAVGDVAGIGPAALGIVEPGDDHAHLEAQQPVDGAHPAGVAAGQIVVDRHHVHALAFQGVQIGGQGRDQRLALAGLHLGDAALVEHHAADQLHVEMALAQGPLGGLAHHGERLDQQVVQGLAGRQTLPELVGLGAQGLIVEGGGRRFERVDPVDRLAQGLDQPVVRRTEQPASKDAEHA